MSIQETKTEFKCDHCGQLKFEKMSEDRICGSCTLDIMDGYLPLEPKPDKYGRSGKQMDNSLGTF